MKELFRIKESRFKDTNKLFVPPEKFNVRISGQFGMQYYAEEIARTLKPAKKVNFLISRNTANGLINGKNHSLRTFAHR